MVNESKKRKASDVAGNDMPVKRLQVRPLSYSLANKFLNKMKDIKKMFTSLDSESFSEEIAVVGNEKEYSVKNEKCSTTGKKCGCKGKRITVKVPAAPDLIHLHLNNTDIQSSNEQNGCNTSEEDIRLAAYFKWVDAGMPEGDGLNFWVEAEQELTSNS